MWSQLRGIPEQSHWWNMFDHRSKVRTLDNILKVIVSAQYTVHSADMKSPHQGLLCIAYCGGGRQSPIIGSMIILWKPTPRNNNGHCQAVRLVPQTICAKKGHKLLLTLACLAKTGYVYGTALVDMLIIENAVTQTDESVCSVRTRQ